MSRNRTVLALLVGVLAISIVYAYFATPRLEKAPPRAPERQLSKRPEVKTDGKPADSEDRIDFSYLDQERIDFGGAERDIFNFGRERIRVVAPEPVVHKPVEPVVEPVTVQPPPMEVVNRALSQFTFVGFLEKGGEKTVFLSSSGEMFLVKSGERFGVNQEFLIESIDGDLLRINHPQRGTMELRLVEQQKLNSAVSAPARMAPLPAEEPQTKTRFFSPNSRAPRPIVAPAEEPQEMNQENNPEVEDVPELEEASETNEGEGLEGEINGTNQ